MIQYPDGKNKDEYIKQLLNEYKQKNPCFTEKQLRIAIGYTTSNLESLLKKGILVSSDYQLCYNVEMLSKMLDLSLEEYNLLAESKLEPKIFFNWLYGLSMPNQEIVQLMLKQDCKEGADVLKGVHKEKYLSYVKEVSRRCITEITQATQENIPDEVKEAYLKTKQQTAEKQGSKKGSAASSSSPSNTPCPSPSRKRLRGEEEPGSHQPNTENKDMDLDKRIELLETRLAVAEKEVATAKEELATLHKVVDSMSHKLNKLEQRLLNPGQQHSQGSAKDEYQNTTTNAQGLSLHGLHGSGRKDGDSGSESETNSSERAPPVLQG